MTREEQRGELSLIRRLNGMAGIDYPGDPACGSIKAYELATGMRTRCSRRRIDEVQPSTLSLYGLDRDATRPFGRLPGSPPHGGARRAVRADLPRRRRGRRLGRSRRHHGQPQSALTQVELPIAGLLKDLKQRGMLEETLVVWATELAARRERRQTAGTITPTAARPGSPAAASRAASPTARPTRSASTRWKIGIT